LQVIYEEFISYTAQYLLHRCIFFNIINIMENLYLLLVYPGTIVLVGALIFFSPNVYSCIVRFCCRIEEAERIGHHHPVNDLGAASSASIARSSNLSQPRTAPLPRETFNHLASDVITAFWSSIYQMNLNDENTNCVICLCQLQQGERVVRMQFCNHLFHQTCIGPWLHLSLTCPICRSHICAKRPWSMETV
jgi:Ring finger domain